jgi:parvulin-like peptidyl-prolyl isomerase
MDCLALLAMTLTYQIYCEVHSKERIMKMSIKYILIPLFAAFITSTVSFGTTDDANKSNINSIKAIVDDEIITQEEVIKRSIAAIKEAQGKYRGNEFENKVDEIFKNTLDELIDRKVLIKEANKIFGTDEAKKKDLEKDLDSFVKGAVKNVGSLSKYYEIAESQGINPIEKKKELKEDIMIDRIMKENVYNKIIIQPKLLRRYYIENIDEFRQKKEVKLRHIMIKFSTHNNNKEETFSITQQIMKRLEKGEDFSNLAKQFSEAAHADDGGLWSFEEVNELRKDLRDVVYSLKDNECSNIIESPVGYHIFKIELIKPAKTQEFEEVQDEIYKKIFREETIRLKHQYINSLKTSVFIKIVN